MTNGDAASGAEPRVDSEIVEMDGAGRIARITIDNRARLNVLSTPLIRQLTDAMRELYGDPDLRAVVLTGAGDRAFVGGADVRELAELDTVSAYPYITRLHLACAAIRKMPVPVIARIDGYCLGGGIEVAVSCDLRVASTTSTFGMPEVRLGIPSVIEAALMTRLIGPGKTRQLVYTGESIPAEEAADYGLVDKVVPPDTLDEAVDAWARSIATAGPRAIRLQKALVRRWDDIPLDHGIQAGMRSFTQAFATDEPHQRMRQFLDRKRA
jgi:enoyl-CoA hydratase/carnithine racemase